MKQDILKILWDNMKKDPTGSWDSLFENITTELADKFKDTNYDANKKLTEIRKILAD